MTRGEHSPELDELFGTGAGRARRSRVIIGLITVGGAKRLALALVSAKGQ